MLQAQGVRAKITSIEAPSYVITVALQNKLFPQELLLFTKVKANIIN